MKLFIDGDINSYYVQTLCMLFFPGAKFSQEEELTENSDVLSLTMRTSDEGVTAYAEMRSGGKSVKKERFEPYRDGFTKVKTAKIASGVAVLAAGEALFECTPPWGIMTGVRPAKIALPYVQSGMTSSQVRNAMCNEYFLNPKKASLLTDIAEKEAVIIKNTPHLHSLLPDEMRLLLLRFIFHKATAFHDRRLS